jgi:hypothetical protein
MSPLSASLTIDWTTGECFLVAKDGTRYSLSDYEAATRGAARGDAAAQATLRALDHSLRPDATACAEPVRSDDVVAHALADCPDCAAERAAAGDAAHARTAGDRESLAWTAGLDPPLELLLTNPGGRRRTRGKR